MKAMILAAGRGERMMPLTADTPKPLLEVAGQPLIGHHLQRLARAGFREIIINTSYLGEQIQQRLGEGGSYGVRIHYSPEPQPAYETGGGIHHALPLLGRQPFLVVNGDIWCDYPWHRLRQVKTVSAHVLLVDNPHHNPQGDFSLHGLRVRPPDSDTLTYAGAGVFHPEFFASCEAGAFPLGPLLLRAADAGQITGEYYRGQWLDVGTVDRLQDLRRQLSA